MEEERTYGFQGERGTWIRWELAALLAFWLFMMAGPSLLYLLEAPYEFVRPTFQHILADIGLIALLGWILWMSGDSEEMFGLARPRRTDFYWLLGLGLATIIERTFGAYRFHDVLATAAGEPASLTAFLQTFCGLCFMGNLALYIVPAFFEELCFRGVILARIREVTGSGWAAVGTSSLLFALVHLYQGWPAQPYHLVFGLVLGFARLKGCSVWTLTLVHAITNASIGVFEYQT